MSSTGNPAQDLLRHNLFDCAGKVALVTGGSTGIGLMITQALAANGAKVYICSRREDRLENAASVHGKDLAGQIIPLTADVTDKDSLEALASELATREKCLHILVNNAGVAGTSEGPQVRNVSGSEAQPRGNNAQEVKDKLFAPHNSFATWDDVFRVNASSPFFTAVAFLPLLEKATAQTPGFSGCIINISSISGITKQAQNHFAYNCSKAATIHLNEMLATELANNKIKIRVNSIAPGVYPSEMTAMSSSAETNKSALEKKDFEGIPAQRPGNDRDMASVALFLATNQYINGQTVPVDGGWLLVN